MIVVSQFPKLFDISKLKKKLKRASFLCRYFSLSQVNVIISVTPALRNPVVCSRPRRLIKKMQTGEYPSKDGRGWEENVQKMCRVKVKYLKNTGEG